MTDKEKLEILDQLLKEVTDQILQEITNRRNDRQKLLAELDALTSMKGRLYARITRPSE